MMLADPRVLVGAVPVVLLDAARRLELRSQRDCQWSGPESSQPGTIRMSTSDVRMHTWPEKATVSSAVRR